jgi:hypothetical protein
MEHIDKEDLEHIAWCLEYVLELCKASDAPSFKKSHLKNQKILISKIENMIRDYCEHDWHEGSMGTIYCKQCKQRINFKIQ